MTEITFDVFWKLVYMVEFSMCGPYLLSPIFCASDMILCLIMYVLLCFTDTKSFLLMKSLPESVRYL